jgi:hypothetical protein
MDTTGTANLETVNETVGPLFFNDTITLTLPLTKMSRHHHLSLDVWLVNLPR